MKLGYYPGCSLHSTAVEYDLSVRRVFGDLGVDLVELDDWSCCGASAAHNTDHLLSLALPARNLALAAKAGLDLAVPCAACYNRMKIANYEVTNDRAVARKVSDAIGTEYRGEAVPLNALEVVVDRIGVDKVKSLVQQPLKGLKVASYYGCLLVRPPKVMQFDDPEDPRKMDDLMAALGAEPVAWSHKTECCGGSFALSRADIVLKLSSDIINAARASGANCLVTACGLCHGNLDMRQAAMLANGSVTEPMPVYYFTELMGVALGYGPAQVGINKHLVEGGALLARAGLAG